MSTARAVAAAPKQAAPGPSRLSAPAPHALHHPERVIQRKCACGGSCPRCQQDKNNPVQTKLAIRSPGDAFEQEADRVADQVLRMTPDAPSPPSISALAGASSVPESEAHVPVQRKCACSGGSTCSSCEEEKPVQRKEANASADAETETGSVSPTDLGPGQPMPDSVRSSMEWRFGVDFSGVRIHTGARDTQAASSIGALAYTTGTNIVFGHGQYQPESESGQRLLAHELTHVVQQQSGAVAPSIQRQADPGACATASKGIGNTPLTTPCALGSYRGTHELARWHFCVDSDDIVPPDTLDNTNAILNKLPRSTRFLIHGFASREGNATYNLKLACHRANKVGDVVSDGVRAQSSRASAEARESAVRDRVQVATRGATTEFGDDLESNRVVVLYGEIPGAAPPEEPGCEDAPRHLGDVKPEISCDRPTLDLTTRSGGPDLRHFDFCFDSDVFSEGGPAEVTAFAARQASTATYVIHGFASIEGPPDYNQRLSCHRALRVARELANAGVRSENIREVSGLGETTTFSSGVKGMEDLDRVAVVLVENGTITSIPGGKRKARTDADKHSVVDEARDRLLSGQYQSAADFYISFWTCGRTPTVRQAVERLTISVPQRDQDEFEREAANGIEESSVGTNAVQVSNVALRADNAIECVMGRLIDMAFHHSVLASPGLSPDLLTPKPVRKAFDPPPPPLARHLAGLHLISLAGLDACTGPHATAGVSSANGPTGIDEPSTTDPLAGLPPPACARPTQPSRLSEPNAADKKHSGPDFSVLEKSFAPSDGQLKTTAGSAESLKTSPAIMETASDVMKASASVALFGDPDTLKDYEVGFMQTVLDDLLLAEYTTGQIVVQKLPVPIRAAHLRGSVRAPAPWMAATGMQRADEKGLVHVAGNWKFQTEFGALLDLFRPNLPNSVFLDTLQRHTRVAIWLGLRRLGAPLDRFSTFLMDGAIYEVDQNVDAEIHRLTGDMKVLETDTRHEIDPNAPAPEKETFKLTGQFRGAQTDSSPADPRQAQFDTPVSSDIDVFRQFQKIIAPSAASKTGGMTLAQYRQVVRTILDTMIVQTPEEATAGQPGSVSPRLGFVFSPLEIQIRVDPRTGRMLPYLNAEDASSPVQIRCPGLGDRALYHLARALALRLQKRDFLKTGNAVVLAEIPAGGIVPVSLAPLRKEPDLSLNTTVRRDMAEMWACSEKTINSPNFLNPKEFAEAWGVDRNGALVRFPAAPAFFVSTSSDQEQITTNIQCGPLQDGFVLGTIHTHPADDENAPLPSDGDQKKAATAQCGRQHYIISKSRIVAYFPDGKMKDLGDRASLLPKGVTCDQSIPNEVEEI